MPRFTPQRLPPRFTLRGLLAGVLFACVYLAVLRDVFVGGRQAAVSMIFAWAILAVFYIRRRLWVTSFAHCVCPTMAIVAFQLHTLEDLSHICRVSSLVTFPIAFIVLIGRYLHDRSSARWYVLKTDQDESPRFASNEE